MKSNLSSSTNRQQVSLLAALLFPLAVACSSPRQFQGIDGGLGGSAVGGSRGSAGSTASGGSPGTGGTIAAGTGGGAGHSDGGGGAGGAPGDTGGRGPSTGGQAGSSLDGTGGAGGGSNDGVGGTGAASLGIGGAVGGTGAGGAGTGAAGGRGSGGASVSAVLAADSSAFGFGAVLKGGRSTPSTVTVKNMGGTATGPISSSLSTGDFSIGADSCTGSILNPAASCSVGIAFTPASAGSNSRTGTLKLTGSPGGSISLSLSGTVTSLAVDPPTFMFPTTSVSATSITRGFSVTNPTSGSAGATTALTTSMTGNGINDFQVVSDTCTGTLGANSSCNLVVSFKPLNFGPRTVMLAVSGNPVGTATATLTGQAQAPDGQTGCSGNADCISTACITYYRDTDADGLGDNGHTLTACGFTPPSGYASNGGDCDDGDPTMSQNSSFCTSPTTRTYCLMDGVRRTQTCSGAGCVGSYCVGTVDISGTITCNTNLLCTTAQGCSWANSPVNPNGSLPACGMNNGPSLKTCDGPNDCAVGSVCCNSYNVALTSSTTCHVGSCPPGDPGISYVQLCDPLAPVCPFGTTCKGSPGDLMSGQGGWGCI